MFTRRVPSRRRIHWKVGQLKRSSLATSVRLANGRPGSMRLSAAFRISAIFQSSRTGGQLDKNGRRTPAG
ncbi:MAG: hypothetical protein NTX64_09045 [Elusimicrobia bacterium]|nr:hypothetical protein [Elusimicrobiota bacterium]